MRIALAAALLIVPIAIPAAALAATGPQPLGTFGDWVAASYGTGSSKACYAFTAAKTTAPAIAGRGNVLLTVTQRHGATIEVTLAAGYTYPASPTVTLAIGANSLNFYTQGQTAFTTSDAAAITDFQAGATAIAKSSAPKGVTVTDTYSLTGFSAAYGAIMKACP